MTHKRKTDDQDNYQYLPYNIDKEVKVSKIATTVEAILWLLLGSLFFYMILYAGPIFLAFMGAFVSMVLLLSLLMFMAGVKL